MDIGMVRKLGLLFDDAAHLYRGIRLFVVTATLRNLLITQRSQPKTFANDVGFDVECVFGTGFQEPQKAFNDHSRRMVSFEVDEFFSIGRRSIDKGWFLSIVNQVSCVYACIMMSAISVGAGSSYQ